MNNKIDYEPLKLDYKILNIQTIENCYLITVKDSADNIYTIISLFTNIVNGTKVEIDKTFSFQLYSLKNPPCDGYERYIFGGKYDYDLIIDGVNIKFKGGIETGILVTTPNLKGLYFNEN